MTYDELLNELKDFEDELSYIQQELDNVEADIYNAEKMLYNARDTINLQVINLKALIASLAGLRTKASKGAE